jgi:hypothetical protein
VKLQLKARILEPEKAAIARKWLHNHVSEAMNMYRTKEELLEAVFST